MPLKHEMADQPGLHIQTRQINNSLRLSPDMEEKLNNIAEMLGVPKSEIVRKSLRAYLKQLEQNNAWAAGKSLFGKYSSGKSNLSENRKAILQQKLQDKRNAKLCLNRIHMPYAIILLESFFV